MTLQRNLDLSSYHLNRADRAHLFEMYAYGKESNWPPVVEITRSGTGWALTFDYDRPPGTRLGFNTSRGIFSHIEDLMLDKIARLDIHDDAPVDRKLTIYNPHTDEVVARRDFGGSFEAPTFEELVDLAMDQVSKYPQYTRDMFDGWNVGRADVDVESRMGFAILRGEHTLFTDDGDHCSFWSFQNAVRTGCYPDTFSEVTPGSLFHR